MPIPLTNLDKFRVLWQITDNLCRMQSNIRGNATAWKAIAMNRSLSVDNLRLNMHDAANSWLYRLNWVDSVMNDAARKQLLLDVLGPWNFTEKDITDKSDSLRIHINQLSLDPLLSYADCVIACDLLLAAIDAPFSAIPEA